MNVAVVLIEGKEKNKLIASILLENHFWGSKKVDLYEPKDLLKEVDELIEKGYLIASNEPLLLEASMRHIVKDDFSKLRQKFMDEILDWWTE